VKKYLQSPFGFGIIASMPKLPANLILEQMELGPMENFLYFIGDSKTKEIAVVDPAWEVELLSTSAKNKGYKIVAVFLTHGHSDHVNGLDEILSLHDVPAYISKHEASFYMPGHKNIVKVVDGEKLKVGDIEFTCVLTPGHTPGCQCFHYKNVLITGDAMFIDGCGRCDLPGGDAKKMFNSLYNVIMKLPEDTVVYPGHNYGPVPYASLKEQKLSNPYLLCGSEKEFLQQRMGISL